MKQKKIHRLKHITIDEIVEKYMHLHRTGKFGGVKLEFMPLVGVNTLQPQLLNKANDDRKYINLLRDKFTYLIHLLRARQIASGGGFAPINATILQAVFGKDYVRMIETLLKMNILYCDSYYAIGAKSYGYRFDDDVAFTYTLENPRYLSKYADKVKRLFEGTADKQEKESKKILNNNLLYDRYNQSLKLLKLTYKDECLQYLNLHTYINDISREYHYHIVDTYLNTTPSITSVDRNNRIYSIATSTPRIIKPFLNIKFTVDIHNSHPLLFNSIIYDYYNVSLSVRKRLSYVFDTLNMPPNNVRRIIRKTLINNGIEKREIADIPNDVLAYIYTTSVGRFWDVVIPTDETDTMLLRTDIKVLMFAEVFYSKKLTTRGQKYAKIFKAQYPNVYSIVRRQKFEDRTKLANDMMKLESRLFHEILTKLYNKRYRVVSIHDAIVVLDTKANTDCSVEVLSRIIEDVYQSIGLHPSISVDHYGKEYIDRLLANEEKANALITAFKQQLTQLAYSGDEDAAAIIEQMKCCEIELLPSADYSEVIIHPLKIR